jgi:thioredoxin reductase
MTAVLERPKAQRRPEPRPRREPTRPHPPGAYPVVVVGSGPGGLQMSYALSRHGVHHAVLSADEAPGGMFRRFPLYQRLNTWSKPFPPVARGSRAYGWYDWNSLIADEPHHAAYVPEFMDGTSYFPHRSEMERSLEAFAQRAGVSVRYGCRWEATRRTEDGFTLVTSDGEYHCRVAAFAVGMAEPWKPPIPGMEMVPHYVDARPAREYAGRRVFIVGKRNSAFEMADALLPWARGIVLASPRAPLLSLLTHSTAGVRAKYLVPYEDHVMGGGLLVLDAAIERVERTADGWRVHAHGTTTNQPMVFDADDVIATTGFTTPLGDLRELGVTTYNQDRMPRISAYWESTSVPGVYFAGAISTAAIGLRKHGVPGNSGGVSGFRYNARVLAAHIARVHFGIEPTRRSFKAEELVPYFLSEATEAAELWSQRGYLARVVSFGRSGIRDEGVVPLQHFVDVPGPDAAAVVHETDARGDHRPAVYVRRAGNVTEHVLPPHPLSDYRTPEHEAQLRSALAGLI